MSGVLDERHRRNGRVPERLLPMQSLRLQGSIGARYPDSGAGVARNAGMVKAPIAFALNPHGPLQCPRAQLLPSSLQKPVECLLI